MARSFEINARAPDLDPGWHLELFEDGKPAGGGVFPAEAGFYTPEEALQIAYDEALSFATEWMGND